MMTPRESRVLKYLHKRLREDGVTPSYEEIADAVNLKSKSGIYQIVHKLQKHGFIEKPPRRHRSIEILRVPESWEVRQ